MLGKSGRDTSQLTRTAVKLLGMQTYYDYHSLLRQAVENGLMSAPYF